MTAYLITVKTHTGADAEIYTFPCADTRADFIRVITNMDELEYATAETED